MARTVTLNGVNFSVPELNDNGYGTALMTYLVALASAFPQLGGAWALTSELDLGASFGLKTLYVKSETASPAAAGVIRLAKTDAIAFRNAANSGDVALAKDTGDALTFAGNNVTGNPFLGANTTAGQSIPNAAATIVVFGTVETDTDSAYASGTGRFTVPTGKGGQYNISGQIAWNGALTTTTVLSIFKNAAAVKTAQEVNPGAGASINVEATLVLAAGDIIDVRATQSSGAGAALNVTAALNYLSIKRTST